MRAESQLKLRKEEESKKARESNEINRKAHAEMAQSNLEQKRRRA